MMKTLLWILVLVLFFTVRQHSGQIKALEVQCSPKLEMRAR